ncbi:MAG TPA: penicillin-binding protein 1C [Desulfomonilaceae bacterium]|nr:penicillin-binding protein 1C [Desulfomonilaceae bacterium]
MKFRRNRTVPWLPVLAVCVGFAAVSWFVVYQRLPDYRNALQEQRNRVGTAVLDRNGRILRMFPDGKGRMGLWCEEKSFPAHLKAAVIAAEDQRFYHHPGFDPIAIVRALYTNIREQKTISGASTITEQVVRLIQPRPRTYRAKIVELLAAVKMEWQLSKQRILELDLNLSPMGGNIRGAGLAARIYFGKDVENITVAEAAVLAALPRSPSRLDPRRPAGRKLVFIEKDRILKRMAAQGWISDEQLKVSLGPSVVFKNRSIPIQAPHFVDLVLATRGETAATVKTTLDFGLQQGLEQVLRSHRDRLRRMGIDQAAAIIASCQNAEVLALVGSLGYSQRDQGFNNGVLASRSAGSTLKPFLYALALEKGYGSISEISDTDRVYQTPHGDYMPMNADRREYGPVNVRSALGNSLNVSAVKVARWVGLEDFYRLLDRVEVITGNSPPPDHYGLGLAVGNVEVSLYKLAQAFIPLASEGEFRPLRVTPGTGAYASRVLSPEVAYIITHILADPSARLLTFGNPGYFDFGFPVAVKTGTSSNYRDAWVIGYTSRHVIGIWAGNFDGRPSPGRMGAGVCGPMLREVVRLLYGAAPPEDFNRPATVREEIVCSMSGRKASSKCPYTASELVVARHTLATCDLPHEDEHHHLGPSYARWLQRREAQHGVSRFKLMKPEKTMSRGGGEIVGLRGSRGLGPADRTSRIEIISPHNRDRFILSRHRPNGIVFRALPDRVVEHVIWVLDGMELARTGPPYEFFWEPTRGSHELLAVTPDNSAAKASFFVE